MASTDAKPVPQKNVAYRVTFPILDADGDLVTGATALDSEVSLDGGTFADCTNEATEIATSSGVYYLDLTSAEMNADTVAVIVKTSTAGAKTTTLVMYPEEAGDIRVNVTAFGGSAGTFSGGRPEVNTTHIAGTSQTAGDIIGDTNDIQSRLPAALVSGRIDASVGAMAANVVTASAIATGAIDADAIAADAITDAKVASDVTIASVTGAVGSVTGNVGGNVVGTVASVVGNVGGNVVGSVASVTGNVTGSVGSLATQAKADVNAEVVDALNVDTYAEPGQGAPAATASLVAKLGYLYKAWRNKTTQTGDQYSLYADNATTIDQKATVSDNGTTFTRNEVATGP